MTPDRPNILLITDDEHRWDYVEGGAVETLRTPALSRLAREGVTFTHGYSVCPICVPTRLSWMTGLYASQCNAGLLYNFHAWPSDRPTFAQHLQRAGYRTAVVGKVHSGLSEKSEDPIPPIQALGFDEVFEVSGKSLSPVSHPYCRYSQYLRENGWADSYRAQRDSRVAMLGGRERHEPFFLSQEHHMDAFVGGRAERWLAEVDADRPFFLHASFCGPHFPLDPPEPYCSRYDPARMPPPVGVDDDQQVADWQAQRAAYCGLIEFIDAWVGRLLDVLDRRRLADRTVVIFTTDHGDMMGDHGLMYKNVAYDASVRTPVILRGPCVRRGAVSEALVESVDLPLTILEAAGVCGTAHELLPCTPGRSYWSCASDPGREHRPWVFSECATWGQPLEAGWKMCRDRRWKYVCHGGGRPDQLFDMVGDPQERRNLVQDAQQQDRLSTMRRRLALASMRLASPFPLPPWAVGETRPDPASRPDER